MQFVVFASEMESNGIFAAQGWALPPRPAPARWRYGHAAFPATTNLSLGENKRALESFLPKIASDQW